jgi:hypothetical protein
MGKVKAISKALDLLAKIEKKHLPTEVQMKLRITYIYFNTYMSMGKLDKAKAYYKQLRHSKQPAQDVCHVAY